MKAFAWIFTVASLLLATSHCIFSQERYSKVSIPISSRQDVVKIARLGISLEGVARGVKDRLDLFVSDQEVRLLKANGIAYTTLIPDWQTYYAEQQKQETQPTSNLLRKSQVSNFHFGSMGGFLTLDELRADLDAMRAKYPTLITPRDSIGASYENRPIWAVRISTSPAPGSQPQALYMGCHHSNEPSGMMSLVYFMWYLLENYGSDPEVTTLLDNRELWFIPLVNPDGYYYNQRTNPAGGGMWRKNRHPNADSASVGVNLNCNYGFKWGYDDIGSSAVPSAAPYRGTGPFSEPETQAIRNFVQARHFTTAHSFHAYCDWIIPPWAYLNQETPDSTFFRAMEEEMTAYNRYSSGAEFDIDGVANGEAGDWMYGDTTSKAKIYYFCVEVGALADGNWPTLSRILPIVMENVRTNLVLAHAAGNYVRINKPNVDYQFSVDSALISVPFINSGAGMSATTIDIKVSCPDLGMVATQFNSYAWDGLGPLKIRAQKNKPAGTNVSMFFELDYPGGKTLDTLTFRLGPASIIYADDAEGTRSRWVSATYSFMQWDTTNAQAHSGRLSFSESPNGNYSLNLENTFTLDSSLVLAGTAAELRFWIKGRSGNKYDCLRAEISTNRGAAWSPLAGRYTAPGSGMGSETPFQSPVLDGYIYDWVEECMDLSGYIGNAIQIRFRFTSKGGSIVYDGFYVDDIKVLTYGNLNYADHIVLAPGYCRPGIDTLRIRAHVVNPNAHPLTVTAYYETGSSIVDSSLFYDDGLHGDSVAADGIWGTMWKVPPGEALYTVCISVYDPVDATRPFTNRYFPTAGPVTADGFLDQKGWGFWYIRIRFHNGGQAMTIKNASVRILSQDTWINQNYSTVVSLPDLSPQSSGWVDSWRTIAFVDSLAPKPLHFNLKFEIMSDGQIFWTDSLRLLTGVYDQRALPLTYQLSQNYPNPFNPSTTIIYQIPKRSFVSLKVFDLLGREVATLVNEQKNTGKYSVQWDASSFPSGVYFYRLAAGEYVQTRKMLIIE